MRCMPGGGAESSPMQKLPTNDEHATNEAGHLSMAAPEQIYERHMTS